MLPLPLLALLVLGPPEDAAAQPERVDVVAVDGVPVESAPTQPEATPEGPRSAEPESAQPHSFVDEKAPHSDPDSAHDADKTWQAEIFVDIYFAANSNSPDNHVMRARQTAPRSGEIVPSVVVGSSVIAPPTKNHGGSSSVCTQVQPSTH